MVISDTMMPPPSGESSSGWVIVRARPRWCGEVLRCLRPRLRCPRRRSRSQMEGGGEVGQDGVGVPADPGRAEVDAVDLANPQPGVLGRPGVEGCRQPAC